MKKFVLIGALTLVAMVSCSRVQSSAPKSFMGEETSVHSIDEKYEYPIDENIRSSAFWVETLSDSIDYLVLPFDFPRTSETDSLVDFYNISAAANALHADLYLQTRGYLEPNEMPVFNDSGVSSISKVGFLHNLARAIRNPYNPDDDEEFWNKLDSSFGELNDSVWPNYFDTFFEKIDTLMVNKARDESQYVADFASLNEKVKNKKMSHQSLLEQCLEEKYFIPQTVLAQQYAVVCYAQNDTVYTRQQATGLLQSLLEAGIYSPFLPEIWRMWRCRIQIDILSVSNDGEIQNHLYNKMRNNVALTLLREYSTHRKPDALYAFLRLATERNIIRSGSRYGNYAFFEDMDLFWSNIKHDEPD